MSFIPFPSRAGVSILIRQGYQAIVFPAEFLSFVSSYILVLPGPLQKKVRKYYNRFGLLTAFLVLPLFLSEAKKFTFP